MTKSHYIYIQTSGYHFYSSFRFCSLRKFVIWVFLRLFTSTINTISRKIINSYTILKKLHKIDAWTRRLPIRLPVPTACGEIRWSHSEYTADNDNELITRADQHGELVNFAHRVHVAKTMTFCEYSVDQFTVNCWMKCRTLAEILLSKMFNNTLLLILWQSCPRNVLLKLSECEFVLTYLVSQFTGTDHYYSRVRSVRRAKCLTKW